MEVVTWSPHMTAERAAEHGAVFGQPGRIAGDVRQVVSLHLSAVAARGNC